MTDITAEITLLYIITDFNGIAQQVIPKFFMNIAHLRHFFTEEQMQEWTNGKKYAIFYGEYLCAGGNIEKWVN